MRIFMSIALVLWLAGFAPAAEPARSHTMTPEMRRQHNSMSVMNKQWAVCKKCLEAGDFATAGASLARMQKAAGDLEKFRLHKNAERMEDFREQVNNSRDDSDSGQKRSCDQVGRSHIQRKEQAS
ncbi:MAG: hypothetical protein Q7J31_14960, partial [Syntrophales bacterium]|nr:hypothetical protein [Syntrophales bacterium]